MNSFTSSASTTLTLGWLINPQDQQVEIYRQGQEKEVRSLPTELSGEAVLPGFVLPVPPFPNETEKS